jgi:hypothetical protein
MEITVEIVAEVFGRRILEILSLDRGSTIRDIGDSIGNL